jgi:hypothetical protein
MGMQPSFIPLWINKNGRKSQMEKKPETETGEQVATSRIGMWIGVGVALGVALGAALENIGVGLAIGLVIGAAIGLAIDRRSQTPKKTDDQS